MKEAEAQIGQEKKYFYKINKSVGSISSTQNSYLPKPLH